MQGHQVGQQDIKVVVGNDKKVKEIDRKRRSERVGKGKANVQGKKKAGKKKCMEDRKSNCGINVNI